MNFKTEKLTLQHGNAEIISIQTNDQNSLTKSSMQEFAGMIENLKKDESIKGVILTSENHKFFCNGIDANTVSHLPKDEIADFMSWICILFGILLKFDKPLIAEVTGHAMGGGAVLTIACDYKFMLETGCRIGFTEVMFGLPLPGMFVYKIQESLHPTKVNEVCLEAKQYKAKEAKEVGLIDETALTREGIRDLSIQKFETLFGYPASAIRHTKANINQKSLLNFEEHLKNARENFTDPIISENLMEAMKAFKEKRKPVFK
ncbi:MAG: enoyl-CoA hydratase/isomerase family protein [Leptospiraceae bacterium]|nr:enoyl-CoA hydratase/isomerase family protein [Leptospiraceae bacterium]